jgi:hypothetical protein
MGTLTVVNVRDFAAPTTTSQVQAAANAVPAEGGILFFSEGVYEIEPPIILKSNTWVLGTGRASIIQRAANSSTAGILQILSCSGVRVSNLAIDMNVDFNYCTGVEINVAAVSLATGELVEPWHAFDGAAGEGPARPSSDIMIESCYIYSSAEPAPFQTQHAVLQRAAERIWIINNHLWRTQIKAGTTIGAAHPSSSGPVFIKNNQIIDAHNMGISWVAQNEFDNLHDVEIVGNFIDGYQAVGIYFGCDNGSIARAKCNKVLICGNIVKGAGQDAGILGRACQESANWVIDNNIIMNERDLPQNARGIMIDTPDNMQPDNFGYAVLKNVAITNNVVSNQPLAGILVRGDVSRFTITGNRVENTQGIQLQCRTGRPVRDGIVMSNYVEGRGTEGLLISTTGTGGGEAADIGPILVRDNILKNHRQDLEGNAQGILVQADVGFKATVDAHGNKCYDDQTSKTQTWGIREIGGGTFDTRYMMNDLRYNLSAGLHVGAGAKIQFNLGWVTESQGTETIPAGHLPRFVVVNHGLNIAPALESISITITRAANDPGYVWVSNVTEQAFQVNCSRRLLEGGLTFGWQVIAL